MISFTAIIVLSAIAGTLGIILAVLDRYIASYGECNLTINDNEPLVVEGGNTVLQCLLDNNIFIPSACGGRATCGFCKLKILEGGGMLLPTETPFLTKDEIRQNVRLTCQVKVKEDIKIIIPEDLLNVKRYLTTVTNIEDLTYDTKRIVMKFEEGETMEPKAGQYLQFEVPGTAEFRAYSIASPPSSIDGADIIGSLVPGGLCTEYICQQLAEGDQIYITGPYGEFYLQEESKKEIICVAGGSGVAPIKAITQHLFEKGTDRKVTYFFGARAKKDLYYYEECLELEKKFNNFKYVVALSDMDPDDKWEGETGFIHTVIDKMYDNCENMEGYLCGPPVMVDAVIGVLMEKGMPEENIFCDKF